MSDIILHLTITRFRIFQHRDIRLSVISNF